MSHGSGLYTIPNVAAGATQVIPAARGFDVDEIRHDPRVHAGTKFFAAPTMVMRLVDAYAAHGTAPEHLKTIIYGGGPMYVADSVRALDVLRSAAGADLRPGRIADDDHRARRRPSTWTITTAGGSSGSARSGARRSASRSRCSTKTTGRCSRASIGEVCVRGDTVMAGYLNNPQATAEALRRRLAAHRRSRPLRCRRLPDAGRSQQGSDHLGRLEHLSARSRGSAAAASGGQGSRGHRRTRSRMGRGGRRGAGPRSRP